MSRSLSEDSQSSPRRRSISDSAFRSALLAFSVATIWASISFLWVGLLVLSGGGVCCCALVTLRSSSAMRLWAIWSSAWVCPSVFSWLFRCATLICCVAKNSISSYAFPDCSSVANSWVASRMTGSFRSSFSSIWTSFPFRRSFLISDVVARSVATGSTPPSVMSLHVVSSIPVGASFTRPRPSFLFRRRLFGRGLPWQGASS